ELPPAEPRLSEAFPAGIGSGILDFASEFSASDLSSSSGFLFVSTTLDSGGSSVPFRPWSSRGRREEEVKGRECVRRSWTFGECRAAWLCIEEKATKQR